MSYVLDLNILKPEERTITIDDKTFNLTIIPAEYAFETYEFIPLIEKLEKTKKLEKDEFFQLLKMYARIFHDADETVDYEWVRKRVNFTLFNEITPIIFSAIFATSKKNEENGEASTKST